MPIAQEELRTIVPTLIIGVGGTGLEVIARLRRLVTESYGSLDKLPILGFLHIDTDQSYKISNPVMAGPPLEASEKYWSRVKLEDAEEITNSPNSYSWFHEWLPPELISKPGLLASEEGAGQIRACGRFSFFFNRDRIREKCAEARRRIQNHEQTMIANYNLTVQPKLNIFVIGSISGGTGSGMLIDLGYSLREWFRGENGLETTAIIPSPDAFSGIASGLRIKENGYAALMELNYFSDTNTTYSVLYGPTENSRLEERRPPYDYTYIVGTNNELVTLKADTVREMMAQNIFLDLVSDYSPYKRSIRDNTKRLIGGRNDQPINNKAEPLGRSYPLNFMSFGIASIEIPIHQIRNYLSALLAADLYKWWLNSEVLLPSDMELDIERELKAIKLLNRELRAEILLAQDGRPYQQIIQQWLKSVTEEIIKENRLQCTSQLPNPPFFAEETGKILEFIDGYLQPKVEEYRLDHLRNDQKRRGDFIQRMYNNENQFVNSAAIALQEKLYSYLVDRDRGPKFLKVMLELIEGNFNTQIEQLDREAEKTWEVVEKVGLDEYAAALSKINEFRTRWMATKQDWMNKQYDEAFKGLGKSLQAGLERESRLIAAKVLRSLLGTVNQLKSQLNRWIMRMEQSEAKFREYAKQEANQVDALEFVGLKLFQPQELNELYADFVAITGGRDVLSQQMTEQVLARSNQSKFWSQSPHAATTFRLLDVQKIAEVQYSEFEEVVDKTTGRFIQEAPPQSKLYSNMDACTRFMKRYPEESEQQTQVELLFNRSKPLVRLDRNIPLGRFDYITIPQAGVIGGENASEPAAQRQVRILQRYFTADGAIAPLTERERHKILAVQEVGGFSLRCISGTTILRSSYQKWRGERIRAERAILKGGKADLPIPVHIQKDMVFWDFMPSDPEVEKLVLIARAFSILKQETNQKTKKDVIRYRKNSELGEDIVTLASTWEDAVQILELPDCRDDRREVQNQLDKLLDQAETDLQKQQLRTMLDAFLTERLRSEFRKIGQDYPRYLQERTIIQEFIADNKLGSKINPDDCNLNVPPNSYFGFSVSPEHSPSKPPTNKDEPVNQLLSKPKFCSQCGNSLIESHRFCSNCGSPVP
jgi:hypothetical protein